jgi:hypothetical protein
MAKFEEILSMDRIGYNNYKKLSEDKKKKFEAEYKKTFRFKFNELNYFMRKYINKWSD